MILAIAIAPACKGDKGDPGGAGPSGAQGPAGRAGDQGPMGMAGRQGTHGQDGEMGEQGEMGAMGLPGVPGPAGPEGPAGRTVILSESSKLGYEISPVAITTSSAATDQELEMIGRGSYIVNAIAGCNDCHADVM